MGSFFLLFSISGQITYQKSQILRNIRLYLICWVLPLLNQVQSGIEKSRDCRLVNMKRNILSGDLLSFCSCFNIFFICALSLLFLSCHRCPRWLRRVWDMSGIPFTRSLAVRHRNSVTLWRPLLTCRFVCLRSLTWCICVLLFVCLFFLLFVCLLSLTCCICRRCSRYRGCSVFVCLSFFCLFVCYHSRAINVESVLRLEMLDPSLSCKADRRPVEVGPAEFLKCGKLL